MDLEKEFLDKYEGIKRKYFETNSVGLCTSRTIKPEEAEEFVKSTKEFVRLGRRIRGELGFEKIKNGKFESDYNHIIHNLWFEYRKFQTEKPEDKKGTVREKEIREKINELLDRIKNNDNNYQKYSIACADLNIYEYEILVLEPEYAWIFMKDKKFKAWIMNTRILCAPIGKRSVALCAPHKIPDEIVP